VTAAWADERVFSRVAGNSMPRRTTCTLHYVAGGQFYVTGDSLQLPSSMPD
jgi:hypothetical protein